MKKSSQEKEFETLSTEVDTYKLALREAEQEAYEAYEEGFVSEGDCALLRTELREAEDRVKLWLTTHPEFKVRK